jgi:pimeloyl-ACP methyl ester carboxylesterase
VKALALKLFGALLFLSALAMWLSRAPDWPVESLVARWAPPPSRFVDLDGQLVHLRDEGPRDDPVPLVLVHGTSASLHTWEGWVAALRTQHRVISFDLPGFGLSGPSAAGDYRGDTYARFVLSLMDRLKVQRFSIGGNSLGGEVAWRTAWLAPERVAHLILVDSGGQAFESKSMPIGFWIARLPLVPQLFGSLLPRPMVLSSVRNAYGDPSKVSDELVERYYQLTLREGNRAALVQRMRQVNRGADAERIGELKVPTLILWGAKDRLIPPEVARQFHEQIAGSELVVFPELGHVPHEEDARQTASAVKAFLARR